MPSTFDVVGLMRRGGAFLVVGGVAFLVDAAIYNLLVFWVTGSGPFFHAPLTAKIVAIIIATIVTYVGNRFWTFGQRNVPRRLSRYVLFVGINIVAALLQLGCLAFSRYVLGLDNVLADNISGTVVGQVLATVFRFVTYDRWVFRNEPDQEGRVDPKEADVSQGPGIRSV